MCRLDRASRLNWLEDLHNKWRRDRCDGQLADPREHVALEAAHHQGGVTLRPQHLLTLVPIAGDRLESAAHQRCLLGGALSLGNQRIDPSEQRACGGLAQLARLRERDGRIRSEDHPLLLAPESILPAPRFETAGEHVKVEPLRVAQLVWPLA